MLLSSCAASRGVGEQTAGVSPSPAATARAGAPAAPSAKPSSAARAASAEPGGASRSVPPEDLEEPDDTGATEEELFVETPPDPPVAPVPPGRARPRRRERPYKDLSDAELRRRISRNPKGLDSMSVGYAYAGALFNGVRMPLSPRWTIRNRREAWGTQETVEFISAAVNAVHRAFPSKTPPLYIGDLSDSNGGQLNRHKSHQSGRDVDLGFYYRNPKAHWYTVANHRTLDRARTWALVRALLTETDVKLILINTSVQRLLFQHALRIGEDRTWLERVFQYPRRNRGAIIRHAPGHHTHIHVRFYNRQAQELGRRAYKHLLARKLIRPPTWYVKHRVRRGDSLNKLARRYRTSVRAIRRANGLRSNLIRAGRTYRIPRKGGVRVSRQPVRVPERREPPSTPSSLLAMVRPQSRPGVAVAARPKPKPAAEPTAKPTAKPRAKPKAKPTVVAAATPPASAGPSRRSLNLPVLQSRATLRPTAGAKPETEDRLTALAQLALKAVAALPGSAGDASQRAAAAAGKPAARKPRRGASSEPRRRAQAKPKRPRRRRSSRRSKPPRWKRYKVRSGDSLWRIAHRNNVKVADLRRWNSLRGDHLEPGQTLRLRR